MSFDAPLQCALDGVEAYCKKNSHPRSLVMKHRVRAMLRAYWEKWKTAFDQFEVVEVEKLIIAPLMNMETGKTSPFLAAGKLDAIVRWKSNRKYVLIDHKFLSKAFGPKEIEHLLISGQLNQYAYLAHTARKKVDAAIWDIIAKPAHRPYKESVKIVTPAKPERVLQRACKGLPAGTLIKATEEVRETTPAETPEQFEQRVFETMCLEDSSYFQRPRIPVLKHNAANAIHEFYFWSTMINPDAEVHLRNPNSCLDYSRACEYMSLCSGKSSEDDGTWKIKEDHELHPELELPDGVDPKMLLTNSRMAIFRDCPLKHHRKFHQGLVKIKDPDEEEYLWVGSAGHQGLEWMFKYLGNLPISEPAR